HRPSHAQPAGLERDTDGRPSAFSGGSRRRRRAWPAVQTAVQTRGVCMKALVWHSSASQGPGSIGEVDLPVLEVRERGLVLAGVEVVDVRPGSLFDQRDLCFEHAFGGGPLASPAADRQARAFGVVNVAYHLRRGLDHLADLLGHQLPHLTAKIGIHAEQKPDWSGAPYRLPAAPYW